jgi:hypothetical protein
MAERAEPAANAHDEQPPEGSVALTALALVQQRGRWLNGERWTARNADGRVLEVWRCGQTEDARRRLWAEAAPGLVRVRHPNLVPVLAAGERDGAIWVASELDAGCPLRRLLTIATLTPEQAALIAAGVLGGLQALHEAGLWHGDLDARTVHVGSAGQVRLGEWGLRVDAQDPDAGRRGDRQGAVRLLGRLGTSVRRQGRRQVDSVAAMLRVLQACEGAGDEEVALLERAGEAAAAVLHGRAGERATAEVAALVGMLDRDPPSRAVPVPVPVPVPAPSPAPVSVSVPPRRDALRSPAAVWAPAPHPGRWVAAALAVLLIIAVVGAVALATRNPRSLAVTVPHPGRSASPAPVTRLRGPSTPSPVPTGPRPVPALAPAAAGPITAIEIQPLEGSCQPSATCPVQVTVRLRPQPAAEEVRWSFHVFDRCTGTTDVIPGVSVTALAGWAYVYGTSWPTLSATHPLALVAVTESPAAAASPAVLAGGSGPC